MPAPGSRRVRSRAEAPEPERRQLTCVFCDLENSVDLSERTDPEELREILAAYQQACARVIRRFEGHIARYFGDGILVYFGFPRAHEDDPQRAVRAGLGIREAVQQLSLQLEREHGVRLHARIGVHTGVVVAGDIAPGQELETMAAIGDTPNIAARLQALAAPDTVVISSKTYALIVGYFHCRELGLRSLRGISTPMAVYEVLNQSGARSRLDVADATRGLAPLAGRTDELHQLLAQWDDAVHGAARSVLVLGEPGIGKSRLIRELEERVANAPEAAIVRLDCSPYFQNTAFYPVIDFLQRLLELTPEATTGERLNRLDGFLTQYGLAVTQFAPLLAELLSLAVGDRYPPLETSPARRRQLLMDALVEIVLLRARRQPLFLVVEDLHWADPSTVDLIQHLLCRTADVRLLLVLSSRDEVALGVGSQRLLLDRLDAQASRVIVDSAARTVLPQQVLEQVLRKADGVPLYLEELARFVVDMGLVAADADRELKPLSIPASLADSLNARLDQQSGSKRVAQLGATIGRDFAYDLLAAVMRKLGRLNQARLRRDLGHLVDAGLLAVDPTASRLTYRFKHALIRDGAYDSLLRLTRQKYHRLIAETLTGAPGFAGEVVPELLAHHYTQAGMLQESLPWWLRAGQRAIAGSAYLEAIAHLSTGLELLASMPASVERSAQELELRLTLGPAYMATRGYAAQAVEDCYGRARALCRELGNPPKLAPVIYGLWSYHIVRAQHYTALELGQQILAIGKASASSALEVQGNLAVGWSQMFLGRFAAAREHLQRVLQSYAPDEQPLHAYMVDDPATSAGCCLGLVEWFLGYQDRARHIREQTLERLKSMSNPYNVAFGLMVNGFLSIALDDYAATGELAARTIELSAQHGLPLTGANGRILHGYALACVGEIDAGIAEMREALAGYVGMGAELAMPYWYWLLADASQRGGAYEEALEHLAACEAAMARTDEVYFAPEMHRLRGAVLWRLGQRPVAAQQAVERAIAVAADADSHSLEMRARLTLAEMYVEQHRREDARRLLKDTYGWFTEGFDWEVMHRTRALLEELNETGAVGARVVSRGA